jgi:hypothetical protein
MSSEHTHWLLLGSGWVVHSALYVNELPVPNDHSIVRPQTYHHAHITILHTMMAIGVGTIGWRRPAREIISRSSDSYLHPLSKDWTMKSNGADRML